ncbi:hypothetical protein DSO57_1001562 [Entomophthora muscae]|uniref:Uncharacterized protein n=1 Tax=Entomophthora muscae TaxID=34485 RepID=A0ACC2SB38_9FUNG|nr:hypothetical protein DSO57_1001562 [Entomophthora muscae]
MGKLNSNRKVSLVSHKSRNSSPEEDSENESRPRIKLVLKVPEAKRDYPNVNRSTQRSLPPKELHPVNDYTSDSSLSEGEAAHYYKSTVYTEISSSPLSETIPIALQPPAIESSKSSSKKKKKKSKSKKSKSKKSHRKESKKDKRDNQNEEDSCSKYKLKASHTKPSTFDDLSSPLTSEPEGLALPSRKEFPKEIIDSLSFDDYSSPLSESISTVRDIDYSAPPGKLTIRLPPNVESATSSPLTPEYWQSAAPEYRTYREDQRSVAASPRALSNLTSPISPSESLQQESPLISLSISDASPKIVPQRDPVLPKALSKLKANAAENSDNSSQFPPSEYTPLTTSPLGPSKLSRLSRLGSIASEAQDDFASEATPSIKEDTVVAEPGSTEVSGKPKAKRKRKAVYRLNPLKKTVQSRAVANENSELPLKPAPKTTKSLRDVILKLLETACKRDKYGVFLEPVDPDEVPDYHTVIKNPMDFGTMRKNIEKSLYKDLDAFLHDFRLVCSNAMTYNDPNTVYYKSANRILDLGLAAAEKERIYIVPDPVEPEPEPPAKEEIVDVVGGNPPASICPSPAAETPAAEPLEMPVKKQRRILQKAPYTRPPPSDGSFDPRHFRPHQQTCLNIPKLEPAWISRKAPHVEGAEYPAGFLHYGPFPSLKTDSNVPQKENAYLTLGDTKGVAYGASIASFVSGLGPEIQKLATKRLNEISCNTYSLMKTTRKIVCASLKAKARLN